MSLHFGQEELDSERYPLYWFGVLAVAVGALTIHFIAAGNYGYFRDELYYLACTKHLDWGFVDQPPLSIFVLKLFISIFGDSLFAVRLPGFLAGFLSCFVFAQLARENGGSERAQVIAACFPAFSPVVAVVTHLYSMNGLDILLSSLVVLTFLRARNPNRPGYWLIFGITLGFALLNKLSAGLLFAALGTSLILTHRRRDLVRWQSWTGVLIAGLIASPYLAWTIQSNYLPLEFIRNATQNKMLAVSPAQFLITQVVAAGPVFFALVIAGLIQGFKRNPFRPQTIAFLLVLSVLIMSQKSRENYLAPAYALIIPIGAVAITPWLEEKKLRIRIFDILLVASSFLSLILALPILPVRTLSAVLSPITKHIPSSETGPKSPIQGHADMFGWQEMASTTKQVWQSLPEKQRVSTPIFGSNYGEASALAHFIKDTKISIIGRHNNWWLWGPRNWDGKSLIIVGNLPIEIQNQFESYKVVKTLNNQYAVPEEANAPIIHATNLKIPVSEFWKQVKLIQ